jgi:hypothetical protein
MAEIKHHFRAGKINKDLDERLIPNGEYRDALNLEVASSQGDDVGTLQSVAGNVGLSTLGIAGAECIGSYADRTNDKIYWFVTGTLVDAIVEYDPRKNLYKPIIVDAPATEADAVLRFSKYWYVCGINIIDGLLFWTDGFTEPKMINIAKFKAGSTNYSTTTTLYNLNGVSGNFQLKDVTVIKTNPGLPPTITMSNTKRSGVIQGTFTSTSAFAYSGSGSNPYIQHSFTFTDALNQIIPLPTTIDPFNITILGSQVMDWQVGDQLKASVSGTGGSGLSSNEIRFRIVQVFSTSTDTFKVTIDSISEEIEQGQQVWDIELVQDKPMFEFKFPRFAYRWKLKDGQYSAIGPWTEVAFLPDGFDYQAKKGYNLGMTNNIRSLKITNFVTADMPKDCVEVDILYKESNNNNIYTVKSISTEYGDVDPEYTANELEITSEIIHASIPANQSLRPWDNVPLFARAQEITGNRLVYGNYQTGYPMRDANGGLVSPKFEVSIGQDNNNATEVRLPGKSIKTLRTYQVGIVYRDALGRETPVFTDAVTGSVILDKSSSDLYNKIKIRVTTPPPAFANSYKYFIKETSNEYYNVAMDRHYAAEDGNAWISFPSSERNKVHEDRFLILKKEHDSDNAVKEEARYKVLAIDNEAPDFLRIQSVSQGTLESNDNNDLFLTSGYPSSNTGHFSIAADEWESVYGTADPNVNNNNTQQLSLHARQDLQVRIFSGTRSTDIYDVANIQFLGSDTAGTYADGSSAGNDASYRVQIESIFKEEDCDWLGNVTDGTSLNSLSIEFFQKQTKKKPEFQGRFFAKLNKDSVLESAILSKANSENYKILQSFEVWQQETNSTSKSYWRNTVKGNSPYNQKGSGWYIDRTKLDINRNAGGTGTDRGGGQIKGFGFRAGQQRIEIAYHYWGDKESDSWEGFWQSFETSHFPQYANIVKAFQTPGSLIRLTDDPNQEVYSVTKWVRNHGIAFDISWVPAGKWGSMRVIRWTLDLDKAVGWAPEDETATINGTNFSLFGGSSTKHVRTPIEILEQFSDEETDAKRSKNPAIFETEPLEDVGLDLYHEASGAYLTASNHGNEQELDWFNCYSFANGIESNRIRDDFNAVTIDKGPKVSTTLAQPYDREKKTSGLIFSGLYNSNSSVNQLNQFIMAEAITKDVDPSYGKIQKLHARDSNLIVLCQDKCLRILCDKDALFNADGSANLVAANRFLGQTMPYVGEYGISMNPESFASYGYQAYFTDKARGAVIRLSKDGITAISDHGTSDYFSDKLNTVDLDKIIGSYNENRKLYNLTINNSSMGFDPHNDYGSTTISFSEKVKGWTSRKSFIPESGLSLNNTYYTFTGGDLYRHGNVNGQYATFYGVFKEPMIKFIFNDHPSIVKRFRTLNYEGSQAYWKATLNDGEYYNNTSVPGWYNIGITTDLQDGVVTEFKKKESKWFNFIEGLSTNVKNIDTSEFAVQGIGQGVVSNDTGGFTEFTLTITENAD